MTAVVIIAAVTLVSATYLTFFNEVTTTIEIENQSVQVDGKNFDEPISHNIDGDGGCCYCFDHTIANNGCEGIWLDWEHIGVPDLEGIGITIIEKEPDCCSHFLESLEVNVLDGQALYDDFEVYVDGILVYTYSASGGSETWILHTIDLTPFQIICCGPHLIEITCTAPQFWTYFNPYGQLGVDTIDLYCQGHVWCDGVDIGKPASEAGHQVSVQVDHGSLPGTNWGPIEPATNGGTWGGIDDCRVAWEYCGAESLARSATVVLTCEDCYEPIECDCDQEPMVIPFWLGSGETIDICICYKLDMMIMPGIYTVTSKLIPMVLTPP